MADSKQDQIKQTEQLSTLTSKIYELHKQIKDVAGEEDKLFGNQIDKSRQLVKDALKLQSIRGDQTKILTELVKLQEENLKVTQDLKEHHEKITEAAKAQLQPLDDMKSKVKGIGDNIQGFILNPWFILGGLLLIGLNYFKQIEEAAQGFRETTGLAVKDTKAIRENAANITAEMAKFGVTAEEAFQASAAIAEQFGDTTRITKETTKNVLTMSKALGLSADESAALLKSSMDMLGASEDTATAFIAGTTQLAKQAKVAPKAVLQDIAQNSEAVAKFSKAGGENIAEAAVQAKKLGTNMAAVAGMAEKLLDFESSIEGQMNAMVLTGRSINLDRARALAIEGDLVGMHREMLRQVGTEAEFNEMNIIERKALADAIGIGVAELGQMVSRASDLEKVSSGAMEPFAAIMAGNKLSDVLDAKGLAGPLANITRSFKSIVIVLGNLLIPLITTLAVLLWPVYTLINLIADSMQNEWVKGLTMIIGLSLTLALIWKTQILQNITGALISPFKTAGGLLSGLMQKMKGFGGLTSKIGTSNKGGIMESLMGKSMTPQKMLAGGAAMVMVAGAVWILAKAMQQFSTGVSWEGVAKGVISLGVLTAAIIGLGILMSSGVGTVAILAGAAAMVIMAGGMWILGKAMQEISKAGDVATPFETLASVAPGILLAASAIIALSGAMTAFSAANVVAAGSGLLATLLGGGIIGQLQDIADMSEPLGSVADSMGRITGTTVTPVFTPEPIGAQVAMAGVGTMSAGINKPSETVPMEEQTTMEDVVKVINKFMKKFDDGVDLKLQGAKIGEFLAKTART